MLRISTFSCYLCVLDLLLLLLHVVSGVEEPDSSGDQGDYENENEQREGATRASFMLAKVAVIVRAAFAFSFLTHAAVLALGIAFFYVEAS